MRQYDARQAIATSSGQNDSGLFQLNFEDPRYLPFEYMGAVSRLRIELPPENNYFDFDTLTDTVVSLNYTAREGGEGLRRAANASAQRHTPGDGWHFFDVRHEFPDAWHLFRDRGHDEHAAERMTFRLTRQMFPFIPGGRDLRIDKLAIVFGPAAIRRAPAPTRRIAPARRRARRGRGRSTSSVATMTHTKKQTCGALPGKNGRACTAASSTRASDLWARMTGPPISSYASRLILVDWSACSCSAATGCIRRHTDASNDRKGDPA